MWSVLPEATWLDHARVAAIPTDVPVGHSDCLQLVAVFDVIPAISRDPVCHR